MDIQTKPIDWFRPNPENAREHPPAQVADIGTSLEEFSQYRNVVARQDGTLLAGHGVVQAALAVGMKELAVHVFEGTDEQARKLMVADNGLSRMAVDDQAALAALLEQIAADSGLAGTGFDEDALAKLVAEMTIVPGAIPEDFKEYDPENMDFEHECPKCGYEW
jgi:ParB-like chromosome segregation protein Spo0J